MFSVRYSGMRERDVILEDIFVLSTFFFLIESYSHTNAFNERVEAIGGIIISKEMRLLKLSTLQLSLSFSLSFLLSRSFSHSFDKMRVKWENMLTFNKAYRISNSLRFAIFLFVFCSSLTLDKVNNARLFRCVSFWIVLPYCKKKIHLPHWWLAVVVGIEMPASTNQMNRMAIEWHTKETRWIKVAYIWTNERVNVWKKKKNQERFAFSSNVRSALWMLCILAHEMNLIWQTQTRYKRRMFHPYWGAWLKENNDKRWKIKKQDLECNAKGVLPKEMPFHPRTIALKRASVHMQRKTWW